MNNNPTLKAQFVTGINQWCTGEDANGYDESSLSDENGDASDPLIGQVNVSNSRPASSWTPLFLEATNSN